MPIHASRCLALTFLLLAGALPGAAQHRVAEGFAHLPPGAKVVVMPMDVELFSRTAGGVDEPKAEWTEQGRKHLTAALLDSQGRLRTTFVELPAGADAGLGELRHLHDAVASAILLHHFGPWPLPSKEGRLDWSIGDGASGLRTATGADYALFLHLRDSYATGGRKATVAVMAVFGVIPLAPGGYQMGFADLVELETGRIIWFNKLLSASGDVREEKPARETLIRLLAEFPE